MGNFDKAFEITKKEEGGYGIDTNNAEVAFGLNRQWNGKWDGWSKIDGMKAQGLNKSQINKNILSDTTLTSSAKSYYKTHYYDPLNLDGVQDQRLVNQAFDFSVNSDYKDAEKNLIKLSGVSAHVVDGRVISALNSKVIARGTTVNTDFHTLRDTHLDNAGLKPDVLASLKKRNSRLAFGADIIKQKIQDNMLVGEQNEIANKKLLQQYDSIETAGFNDKLKAMWYQASVSNDIVTAMQDVKVNGTGLTGVDKQFGLDTKPNDQWRQIVSDETAVGQLLDSFKMPSSYYHDVATSKNQEHFMRIVDKFNTNTMLDDFINNNLGTFGKTTATLGSVLLADPTNIMLPLAIPFKVARSITKASEKYKDVTKAAFATETANELSLLASKAIYEKEVLRAKRIGTAFAGGLATTVPAIKYNTNESYGVSDFLMDTAFYGADMMFLKHAYKNATELQKTTFNRELEAHTLRQSETIEKQGKVNVEDIRTNKNENIKSYHAEKSAELQKIQDDIAETLIVIGSGRKLNTSEFAKYEQALLDEQRIAGELDKLNKVANVDNIKVVDDILTSVGMKAPNIKPDIAVAKQVITDFKTKPLVDIATETGFNATKVLDDLGATSDGAKVNVANDGKVKVTYTDKSGKTKTQMFDTKGKKAVIPTAVVLGLLATEGTASAADSTEFSLINVMALGALLYFGYRGIAGAGKRASGSDAFIEQVKAVGSKAYEAVTSANKVGVSNNPNPVGNAVENMARALNNRLLDTVTPLIKSSNKNVQDIARKLFYFSEKGDLFSAERRKTNIQNKFISMYMDDIDDILEEAYKIEREGSGIIDDMVNMNHKMKVKSDLRKQAALSMQDPYMKASPHVKAIAEIARKTLNHVLSVAKQAGVKGVKELENYMPYYKKTGNMRECLMRGGIDAEIAMQDNLLNMYIGTGIPAEKAAKLVQDEMSRIKAGDRIIRGGEDSELFGDIANRFKSRANMDFSQWKDFTIGEGELAYKVSLDDYMELDVNTILSKYTSEMSGHVALAENGWTHYADAFTDIAKSGGALHEQRELNEGVDLLLGRPSLDHSSNGAKAALIGKNTAAFVMLPMATVNMLTETAKLAFDASKHKGQVMFLLNKLTNGFVSHGYDSKVVQDILDYHAYGHKNKASAVSFRGYYDSLANPQNDANGFMDDMVNASTALRDKVFFYNGMTKATELLEQISVGNRADLLARYVNGQEKIHPMDLEIYGISTKDEQLLREVMTLNSKGHLKSFDINSWSKEQKDAYDRIIDNMKLTDIQEHTLGGTPAYTRNSEIGYAFSALLGFPMQAFSTHAIRLTKGMARMRVESLAETMTWFAGGYVAYAIKSQLQGREFNEEDAIRYGLNMLPMTAPYSVVESMTNPVITSTADRVMSSPEEFIMMMGD